MAERTRKPSERIKLSALTEEQVVELMESIDTDDEEVFSDDDELVDPDYNPAEISPEHETTDAFIAKAVNMSLNLTKEMPCASSTLTAANIEPYIIDETVATLPEVVAETVATTTQAVASSSHQTQKRARSPLPSMETTGPTSTPSAGGFTGASNGYYFLFYFFHFTNSNLITDIESIAKNSKEFSKILWRKQSTCLHVNEVAFRGDTSLQTHLKQLRTPMEIFTFFFHKSRIVSLCIRFINSCRNKKRLSSPITANEMDYAEFVILKIVQRESLSEEIDALKRNKC